MYTPAPLAQLITVEDQTTPDTLTAVDLFNLVWGLNYQVRYHFGRSPWVNAERAPIADVILLPHDSAGVVKPPPGAWNLILLDTSEQEDVLGYHEDTEGNDIPYSEAFIKTALEAGKTASGVGSHELLEMLVDPYVKNIRTARNAGKIYPVEICDPVEGNDYDVGEPEGKKTGVLVSDFVTPAWYGMPQPMDPHRMSFRGSVQIPFQVGDEGYTLIAPENEPSNFTQIFGEKHPTNELPAWASRLPKMGAVR